MTNINCDLTDIIRHDFGSLWQCKQLGKTIEISTPYMLPDSTLFTVLITERSGKYIVCDGGSIMEILEDYCPLPDEDIKDSLKGLAEKFSVKNCLDAEKRTLYFNQCDKISLLSSRIFDLANFATSITNILVSASCDEADVEFDKRFQGKADAFIKDSLPSGLEFKPRQEISHVAGIKFSAVIQNSSKMWLVSYVTGSNLTYFRKSIGETKMNFEHTWESSISSHICRTIPFLNSEAGGYQPDKLKWQIESLEVASRNSLLRWDAKETLATLLN